VGRIRLRTWRRLCLFIRRAFRCDCLPLDLTRATATRRATELPATNTEPTPTGAGDHGKWTLANCSTDHAPLHGRDDPKPMPHERTQPDSYVLDLKLAGPLRHRTRQSRSGQGKSQLQRYCPLASMLSADSVSPLYAQLYDAKVKMLRENSLASICFCRA